MPKKKKKNKFRKKNSKKVKRKTKVRKKRSKKLKKKIKKIKDNGNSTPDIIIKTKPEWAKQSLANKTQYQKK